VSRKKKSKPSRVNSSNGHPRVEPPSPSSPIELGRVGGPEGEGAGVNTPPMRQDAPAAGPEARGASKSGAPSPDVASADREVRFSSRRKTEIVMRLVAGEPLDALARECGVTAARIAEWRGAFLAAGQAALKGRGATAQDEEVRRLKGIVGDLTMRLELSREKIKHMEANLGPFGLTRSRP
jgi:transposase